MTPSTEPSKPTPRRSRKLRWFLGVVALVGFFELLAGRFVARPLRIISRSSDPVLVYENVPGAYLGRATYDVWTAPLYMVLDLMRTNSSDPPTKAPPGYTLYRIDDDGCRAPSEGPFVSQADVLFLGSSQAFGMLISAEDSVPGVLEKSLHERGFGGVRVANCAVIGHRLVQTLRTTERAQKAKHPRLVVTIVRPWHMTEQFDYADVLAPRNERLRWAIDHSSLARVAHYYNRNAGKTLATLTREVLDTALDDYARQMNAAGVRSLFFLLDDPKESCPMFDVLVELMRKKGLGVERLLTPSGPKDMFIDRDHHWSIKGSAYTAGQMVDSVARELEAVGTAPGRPVPPPP